MTGQRPTIDRRDWLRGMGAAALLCGCSVRSGSRPGAAATPEARPRPVAPRRRSADELLDLARRAARFIQSHERATDAGLTWRKSPDDPQESLDLYHGSAGVVLFLAELARATGQSTYLDQAERGLRHIAAASPASPSVWEIGLYGGTAGHVCVALALHAISGESEHRDIASRLTDRLVTSVQRSSADGRHLGGVSDIMYGAAGVIVVLLEAARALQRPDLIGLASQLASELVDNAEPAAPTASGVRWKMTPSDTYYMPNFSHGTAGVAYSLVRLYDETGDKKLLDTALAADRHLLALADTGHGGFRVQHVDPDAPHRFYLAWCHGPPGTARFYHALHRATKDPRWRSRVLACASSVRRSGIPELETGGFWYNAGQCCGSAAVAEFYLGLAALENQPAWEGLAAAVVDHIIARGTPTESGGLEWVHAENRAEPYWRQSYTGYMQGAAGIGSLLIRLAGRTSGKPWKERLPDNPFPV